MQKSKAELEDLLRKRIAAEEHAAEMTAQSSEAQKDVADAQQQLKDLHSLHATHEEKISGLRVQITEHEAHRDTLAAQNETVTQRLAELADVQSRLDEAKQSLKSLEEQRRAGQQAADGLEKKKAKLNNELGALEETLKADHARADEMAKKIVESERRAGELKESAAQLEAALAKLREQESAAQKSLDATRKEEETLRTRVDSLAEDAEITRTKLDDLLKQRTASEKQVAELSKQSSHATQGLAAKQQQIAAAKAEHTTHGDKLAQLHTQIFERQVHQESLNSQNRSAEQRLTELRTQIQERETELVSRTEKLQARLEELRREEDKLNNKLQNTRAEVQKHEVAHEETGKKLAAAQANYEKFTREGNRVVSLADALAGLQSKHDEINRTLREAAENELTLQVKLSSLLENVKKEQQKLDQTRQDRTHEDEDRTRALEKSQRDLEEAKHRIAEELKHEEAALTARMKERVKELEEKHETLRRSLATSLDEKTVMLFSQDLIKRIDLLDILITRFSSPSVNGGVEQQLRTLRASFEDILAQHGISEFRVDPGTEVDVSLRQRIAVVESVAGSAKPKVVESYRPGFIYAGAGGNEVILRKVEVKTSSE